MHTTFISLLILASEALAGVYITNPIATTSVQGGQSLTINWEDDNSAPTLTDIGPCEFGLYAGNMQQQTELQPINPSVDVSKQTSLDFVVNPSVGSNSNAYFIRATSLSLKDSKSPQFPYQAFSAKFALAGMNGQFNATVQAQVDGITSASGASSTSGTSASTSATTGATTSKATTTSGSAAAKSTSGSGSASSSAAKSTQTGAASMTRSNAGVMGVVGVAAALIGLSL